MNSPSPNVIVGIGKDNMFANAFALKQTLKTSSEGQGLGIFLGFAPGC